MGDSATSVKLLPAFSQPPHFSPPARHSYPSLAIAPRLHPVYSVTMGSSGPSTGSSSMAAPRGREASSASMSSDGAPSSSATPAVNQAKRPPPSADADSTTSTAAPTPTGRSPQAGSEDSDDDARRRREARRQELSQLALVVCQQPERARLCSFKEENETIDRRPVDPPPVIELLARDSDYPALLDSTTFFIRASLVAAEPSSTENGQPTYATVKTPTGADATAGEVIQTPERLRHLDGKPGALCIFAKLSVRLPGVFRLKFTLYETAADGLTEITHTVSEPFEVFSPKLFKGMHESTPLTRHLATQGLKVKLRTDLSGNKAPGRRRTSAQGTAYRGASQVSPPVDMASPAPRSAPNRATPVRYPQPVPAGPSSAPSYDAPRGGRSLVWHGQMPTYPYAEVDDRQHRSPSERDGTRKMRRVEDGYGLTDMSSRLEFSLPPPSSDLSAFSLGNGRPQSASAAQYPYWERREPLPGDDGMPSLILSPPPHDGMRRPQTTTRIHERERELRQREHEMQLHRERERDLREREHRDRDRERHERERPRPHDPRVEYGLPRLPRIMPGDEPHHHLPPPHHAPPHHPQHHHPQHAAYHQPHPAHHSHIHQQSVSPHPPQHHLPQHAQHYPSHPAHHAPHHPQHGYHHGQHPQHPPHPAHAPHTQSPPPVLPPIRPSRSPSYPYDRDPRA